MTQLSWFQAVRRVIWKFFSFYYAKVGIDVQGVFELEQKTNELLDTFIDHFFASFAKFRDSLIKSQRDLIAELSVPVIPIMDGTAVLPLIGTLDTHRAKKVQEHVLAELNRLQISRLIIDLSGVAFLDSAVVKHLFRIVDGVKLLGCRAILVGIRPEIANTMIEQRIPLDDNVEIYSTLQQALA
jgi:anti-anti-sigma factor